MQFIKNLFKDESIIGLCGIKKQEIYLEVNIPDYIKKTHTINISKNFLL